MPPIKDEIALLLSSTAVPVYLRKYYLSDIQYIGYYSLSGQHVRLLRFDQGHVISDLIFYFTFYILDLRFVSCWVFFFCFWGGSFFPSLDTVELF